MMRLGALVALSLCSTAATARTVAREPVAIVYSLTGEASLAAPHAIRRPLRLFDRLPAGTTVEAGPGARLALAFVTGKRWEISGPARATLGKGDLVERSGARRLLSVPPLPPLAPIAQEERPGAKAGAIRIRREEIDGLCPRDGAATLAGATILRFQASGGATRYAVEIENARGTVIFRTATEAAAVNVPAGSLAPGARYHWIVTAVDRPGPVLRGETDFVTLTRKTADARERLRRAVEAAGEADSRALIAAVDHSLGLASEMCEGPAWRTK
jgi:hypothetical protein